MIKVRKLRRRAKVMPDKHGDTSPVGSVNLKSLCIMMDESVAVQAKAHGYHDGTQHTARRHSESIYAYLVRTRMHSTTLDNFVNSAH